MTAQTPPPHASGYQPQPGEGITHFELEANPSRDYNGVGLRVGYSFPEPRSYPEALEAIADIWETIKEEAGVKVTELVEAKAMREQQQVRDARSNGEAAPSRAPAPGDADDTHDHGSARQPVQAPPATHGDVPAGDPLADKWEVANQPRGRGTFRYLPTAVVSSKQFVGLAQDALQEAGVPLEQVWIYDDRVGKYGFETDPSNTSWSCGTAKVREDSYLARQLPQGKDIVAYLDFDANGDVEANLSKAGKQVLGQSARQ